MKLKVKIDIPSANQLIRDLGIDPSGAVQMFHTMNVLKRLKRYMPFRTGMTYKIAVAQTDIRKPEIVIDTPGARYAYEGKKMVNAKTGKGPGVIPGVGPRYRKGTILKATEENLVYTKTKNPLAGPHYDRTLAAQEGDAMAEDLRRFIERRHA